MDPTPFKEYDMVGEEQSSFVLQQEPCPIMLFGFKTVSKMLVKYVIQCMRNEMNQGHTTRSNRVSEKDEFCRLQWAGRP